MDRVPGPSRSLLDLVREAQEELAEAMKMREAAIKLRARADGLDKRADAREAAAGQCLSQVRDELSASEIPTGRAPRRPRLEEGPLEDRERAERVRTLVLLHPKLSTREVARQSGVSCDVVRRIRRDLGVVEKVVENPAEPHEVVDKGSAQRRRR
jgi:hypothetical protein